MKITNDLRKEINRAVRDNVDGANPLAEVGLRVHSENEHWQPNCLLWPAYSDLGDLTRLSLLKDINDDPRHPGYHELDLYVTTGIGFNHRELETNVCILIRDGHVVGATSHSLQIGDLKKRVGFPMGDWDDETEAK